MKILKVEVIKYVKNDLTKKEIENEISKYYEVQSTKKKGIGLHPYFLHLGKAELFMCTWSWVQILLLASCNGGCSPSTLDLRSKPPVICCFALLQYK